MILGLRSKEIPWRLRAACLGLDGRLFFPRAINRKNGKKVTAKERDRKGKEICNLCPVRSDCLEAAMTEEAGRPTNMRFGIRGGLNARERSMLYRTRKQRSVRRQRRRQ